MGVMAAEDASSVKCRKSGEKKSANGLQVPRDVVDSLSSKHNNNVVKYNKSEFSRRSLVTYRWWCATVLLHTIAAGLFLVLLILTLWRMFVE